MLLVELTLESILVPMILCLENEFVRLGLSPLFHAAMNNRCFTKCFNISPTITRWCTLCVIVMLQLWLLLVVVCFKLATWLILPVVIRSSQRLSHACLSISDLVLWNCEWLIISVIVYLIVPYYMDTRSNSRANTCIDSQLLRRAGRIY